MTSVEVLARKLAAKTDKTPGLGPEGECWFFTGSRNSAGYGRIDGLRSERSGYFLAHRAAWLVANGYLPRKGETARCFVCHKCDVRHCVNPAHLFLGTPAENTADMLAKGRAPKQPKGENSLTPSKLTRSEVLEIRRDRRVQHAIAAHYGVSQSLVSMIKSGKKWAHVGEHE